VTAAGRTSAGEDRRRLPIGVFDSGVGGLTVVAALQRRLPGEDLLYLGDTARLPYGTKSPDTVRRYARTAARALVERDVKMLVIACNTASAVALEDLVAEFAPLPTIGVVEPGARAAVHASKAGRILVLATESTVRGGAYGRAIAAVHSTLIDEGSQSSPSDGRRLDVRGQACPLFVALAEEGWVEGDVPEAIARRYLAPYFTGATAAPGDALAGSSSDLAAMLDADRGDERSMWGEPDFDTLVLGCTHFPMLAAALRRVVGPDVAIVDSAATTADVVAHELARLDLTRDPTRAEDGVSAANSPVRRLPGTTRVEAARGDAAPDERTSLAALHGLGRAQGGGRSVEPLASASDPPAPADTAARREAGRLVLMATDAPERFARVGSVFLGRTLSPDDVTLIDL
jgi:glutamate racemase